MAGYAQSVGVLDRHHVVGLEVRVRDVHKRVDVVLGEVHHVAVDGADVSVKITNIYNENICSFISPRVPGAAVPQGEGPGADGALVRLGSGVRLPVTSSTKKRVRCHKRI